MNARPVSLKAIRNKLLRLLVSHSAAALFDRHVEEFFDGESVSADDYAELRKALARESNSSLLLVHLKN